MFKIEKISILNSESEREIFNFKNENIYGVDFQTLKKHISFFFDENSTLDNGLDVSMQIVKDDSIFSHSFLSGNEFDGINSFYDDIKKSKSVVVQKKSNGVYMIVNSVDEYIDSNTSREKSIYSQIIFRDIISQIEKPLLIELMGNSNVSINDEKVMDHILESIKGDCHKFVFIDEKLNDNYPILNWITTNSSSTKNNTFISNEKIKHPLFGEKKYNDVILSPETFDRIEYLFNENSKLLDANKIFGFIANEDKFNIYTIKSNSIYVGKYDTKITENELKLLNTLIYSANQNLDWNELVSMIDFLYQMSGAEKYRNALKIIEKEKFEKKIIDDLNQTKLELEKKQQELHQLKKENSTLKKEMESSVRKNTEYNEIISAANKKIIELETIIDEEISLKELSELLDYAIQLNNSEKNKNTNVRFKDFIKSLRGDIKK